MCCASNSGRGGRRVSMESDGQPREGIEVVFGTSNQNEALLFVDSMRGARRSPVEGLVPSVVFWSPVASRSTKSYSFAAAALFQLDTASTSHRMVDAA